MSIHRIQITFCMKPYILAIAAICCTPFILNSCKKTPAKKTTCSSTLHGYTASLSAMYTASPSIPCNPGVINTSTAAIATVGTFPGQILFTAQMAYNTSDNCSYIFGNSDSLYKISSGGALTGFAPADTFNSSIAYSSVTNMLYCIRSGALAQITVASSTYSSSVVATPVHPFALGSSTNLTIDNGTGDIYYLTKNGATYYVEKYHPGSPSPTVVASGGGGLEMMELRFNSSDGKLYGLQLNSDTSTFSFIKADPAAGTITSVASIGTIVDIDMYSATLDPCSNHYIISSRSYTTSTGTPYINFALYQLNMTGAIVQEDTTTTLYQGLNMQE